MRAAPYELVRGALLLAFGGLRRSRFKPGTLILAVALSAFAVIVSLPIMESNIAAQSDDEDDRPTLSMLEHRDNTEGSPVHFRIHLNIANTSELDNDVTVDYATSDGVAGDTDAVAAVGVVKRDNETEQEACAREPNADYISQSGTARFTKTNPDKERHVRVFFCQNDWDEGDPGERKFTITLSNPSANARLDPDTTTTTRTGTIRDDDNEPLITTDSPTHLETEGGFTYTLSLSHPSDLQVTVDYAVDSASTAVAGNNPQDTTGHYVTIEATTTTARVTSPFSSASAIQKPPPWVRPTRPESHALQSRTTSPS